MWAKCGQWNLASELALLDRCLLTVRTPRRTGRQVRSPRGKLNPTKMSQGRSDTNLQLKSSGFMGSLLCLPRRAGEAPTINRLDRRTRCHATQPQADHASV